jgi:BlaI family transcriptional regulator, penicillinase repressor
MDFTARELDVMAVLWERGSGTVAEVRASLTDDLAYTTVLTILRIMEEKGMLRHEGEGRAHRYYPLVERKTAGKSALGRLIDKVFGGSPEMLVTQMVSDRGLSEAELKRLRKLLDKELKR